MCTNQDFWEKNLLLIVSRVALPLNPDERVASSRYYINTFPTKEYVTVSIVHSLGLSLSEYLESYLDLGHAGVGGHFLHVGFEIGGRKVGEGAPTAPTTLLATAAAKHRPQQE